MNRLLPIVLLIALNLDSTARAGLPESAPESLGFDPARLARIDGTVRAAVEAKAVPGAVVLVGRNGRLSYAKAFGSRSLVPTAEPMTRDTVFDMASITKPVATATAVMLLLERGKLRLDDRLSKHLPEFNNHGKGEITVEQLLRHRAGFVADNPIKDFADGPEAAWKRIAELGLESRPGSAYVYSDVGFMTLGRLVERLSGDTLDVFTREEIFRPLGMTDTHFRPAGKVPEGAPAVSRIAPTEPDAPGGTMLRGVVHDPRSRALGGVAGHAGLFSTADDLAVYAQALIDSLNSDRGPAGRPRLLSALTARKMIDPADTPPRERRGLGWDADTPHSAPRGELFGRSGFGHTGFTGTSLWVDPEIGVFVIVLTSRLHPDGKKPAPSGLRSAVATLAAAAIVGPGTKTDAATTEGGNGDVSCGIDVLVRDGFAPLRGKRVGLVTNHTGRTKDGVATIDALWKAPDVKLVALFSPEHGIRGLVDAEVGDGKDEATGLPIHSLYGKTRKPSPQTLDGLDVLVYDIQDIGARFYTYVSTMGLVLEAAKEKGLKVIVLDRPNPVGGVEVSGPVRDDEFASFIAHHALPVRHGMTVGELALMFNTEQKIYADLSVIRCEGWRRNDLYDATGLLWVNPSPNMRSLNEALLYPGVGLLEASNLATGRGTDTPFERLGAPWIEPRGFAKALNALALPGVRFIPIRFVPKERQYSGAECGGVYVQITDRSRLEPVGVGLGIARVLLDQYHGRWKPDGFLKMLADRASYTRLLGGGSLADVEAVWRDELDRFLVVRRKYLTY